MKIILNESRTIPVNPDLYTFVVEKYKNMFEAFLDLHHDFYEVPEDASPEFVDLFKRGGKKYLKKVENDGLMSVFAKRIPLNGLLDYNKDSIIKRKMSKQKFHKRLFDMENSTISLGFFIENTETADEGYFIAHQEELGLDNLILIRFSPFRDFEDTIVTIRHELQHFTQSFYSQIFGLDKWIGLAPPNTIKGQELHGSKDTAHQDIPVEMHTDVEDEIHLFLELMDDVYGKERLKKNPEFMKQKVLNFLNISGEHVGAEKSSMFYHYFLTNREVWKWAVKKLLTSVEAYLK